MRNSKLFVGITAVIIIIAALAVTIGRKGVDKNPQDASSQPMPEYKRIFTYPAYFNDEAKKITDKNIAEAVAAIEKDNTNAGAWVDLGNQYYLVREYEGARVAWDYTLSLEPTNFVALANLGTLYMADLKDFAKAELYLKKAVESDPEQIETYRSLYELYRYALKDDAKAKAILAQGIASNPSTSMDLVYFRDHYNEQ
jgi:tetratricopeptide (TPR) repeat protein